MNNDDKDMSELLDKLHNLFNEYGFSINKIYRKPSFDFIRNEIIYIEILPTGLEEMSKQIWGERQ